MVLFVELFFYKIETVRNLANLVAFIHQYLRDFPILAPRTLNSLFFCHVVFQFVDMLSSFCHPPAEGHLQ